MFLAAVLIMVIAGCSGSNGPPPPAASPKAIPETTAVGTSTGLAETKTIGAGGGMLSLLDGRLELIVPSGALSSDLTLSAQPITNNAFGGLGTAYRLGPEGTTFAKPITLVFKAKAEDLAIVSIEGMGIAFQDAEGYWKRLPGAIFNATDNTLSVTTDHFSDYAPVAVTLLQPLAKTVKCGETVKLEISNCYPVEVSTNPNSWRGYRCGNYLGAVLEDATDWSVSGVIGGNATVGTIKSDGIDSATYTAPAQQPSPSTVDVSTEILFTAVSNIPKVLLFSHITISQPGDFTGTIVINGTDSLYGQKFSVKIPDATLTLLEDNAEETVYTLGGSATISPTTFTIGPNVYSLAEPKTKTLSADARFYVRKNPPSGPPAVRWGYSETWIYSTPTPATAGIAVYFATRKGPTCSVNDDVPIPNLYTLGGTYTTHCASASFISTATWTFTK